MVAPKRRRQASMDEPLVQKSKPEVLATTTASTPAGKTNAETVPAPAGEDPTSQLVRLCVRVLKGISPRGLATKDLATALDAEKEHEPTYKSVSSSVLSSKLNALFRRFHGSDSSVAPTNAQLTDLPLTRRQSEDLPKRLVYVYSPPSSDEDSDEEVEQQDSPAAAVEINHHNHNNTEDNDSIEEPLTPSRGDSEPEADAKDQHKSEPRTKRQRIDSSPLDKAVTTVTTDVERPTTPPEQVSEPPSKLPTTSPNMAVSRTPASKEPAAAAAPKVKEHRPNLYYDTIGSSAFTSVLSTSDVVPDIAKESPDVALLLADEYESPEDLKLSELDSLVC